MAKQYTQRYTLKMNAEGVQTITKEVVQMNSALGTSGSAVKGTTDAFKNAKKAQDPYLRGLKATGGGTNNQSKAFSKMAQGMNGTLVPAYATVAANVFALTALFGALRRAADFDVLTKSAETYAVQTGRSLIGLSQSMKDITNNAITMKEALTSASIAASAGFDNSTIEQLTQVARNASVALGRDMTDSLDRVFKGAIKAEPELLDELGIILRLDPATRKYAAALGKSVSALTTFEKQQAVVNEVIEQGEEKFSEFSNVDVNAFTQLGSAFTDISVAMLQLISTPLVPVLKFISDNVVLLTSLIVLFAASVAKKAFPALENFAEVMQKRFVKATESASDAARQAQQTNVNWVQSLQGTTKAVSKTLDTFERGVFQVSDVVKKEGVKISKNFKTAFAPGPTSLKKLEAYKKGIQGVLTAFKRGTSVSQGFKNTTKNVAFLNEELGETISVIKQVKNQSITTQNRFQAFGAGVTATFTKAKFAVISFGSAVSASLTAGALAGYQHGLTGVRDELRYTAETSKGFTRAFKLVGVSVAGLGGAFLKFLPILGLLTAAWSILSSAFVFIKEALFGKELVNLSDTLSENTEALDTASKSAALFNKRLKDLPDTLDNVHKKATLASNTFANLATNLNKTLEDIDISTGFGDFDNFLDIFGFGDLDEFKDQLLQANNVLKDFGYTEEALSIQTKFNDLLKLSGDEAIEASKKLLVYIKNARDSQRGTLELNNLVTETFEGLSKSLTKLGGALPTLTALEQGLVELGAILRVMDAGNVHEVISAIENLNALDLRQLGLQDTADTIAKIKVPLKELEDKYEKVTDEINKLTQAGINAQKAADKFGGGNIILKVTEKNTAAMKLLIAEQLKYKKATDALTESLASQAAIILPALKKAEVRFKSIAQAQQLLINQRQQISAAGLVQGLNAADRLDLIKQLTDAENTYLKTISKQTKKLGSDVDVAIERVRKSLIAERKKLEEDPNDGKAKGVIASLEADHIANTILKLRIRNKVKEDDAKIVTNSIKLLKASQKELTKISFLTFAGLQGFEDQERFIRTNLITTLEEIAPTLKRADETAESFVARLVLASDSANKLANISKEFKIGDPAALAAELVSIKDKNTLMAEESAFLDSHNVALTARIDKEYILRDLALERQIIALREGIDNDGTTTEAEAAALITITNLERQRKVLEDSRTKSVALSSKKLLKSIKNEIKLAKQLNKLGINANKVNMDALVLEQRIQKLKDKGHDKEAKNLKSELKLLQDINFANAFNAEVSSITEGLSDFTGIIKDLKLQMDNVDVNNLTAGLKGLHDIATVSGDGISLAFADVGLELKRVGELMKAGKGETIQWGEVTSTVAAAMGQAFEDGSDGAKAMQIIQQGLAISSAVAAIATQGEGDPYSAPARIAAMIGIMSSVLSLGGIAFGGSSGGGDGGEQAYKDSISKQGLVGQRDLQSNTLIDSIQDLVEIDTELFSTNRDLQLTLVNLNKTFSKIGASLFNQVGNFEAGNIADLFGKTFGTQGGSASISLKSIGKLLGGGAGGFGSSTSVSNRLVDAGIQLSASIEFVNGELITSLTDASFFLIESVTVVKKKFFGASKKTSTYLRTTFKDIESSLLDELARAISRIGGVVFGLFSSFSNIIDLNLTNLFAGLGTLAFDDLKISLTGKDAEEQAEAIGAFTSLLSATLIESLLPAIGIFSLAGEEFIDTLIRITENIWKIEGSFSTLGMSISSFVDVSSLNALDPNTLFEEAFGGTEIDTSFLESIGVSFGETLSFFETVARFANAPAGFGNLGGFLTKQVENFFFAFFDEATIKKNIASAIEAMKIAVIAAWEEEFLANFKDFDEFNAIFEKFSETLYNETELAQLALENAGNIVGNGFAALRSSLEDAGATDLLELLDSGGASEATLRSIYELGSELGTFAARFDVATGEIDTSGADLLALLIQLGAAMGQENDAAEDLLDALDNLNQQYERQIALFGLVGKELDLLQLSFDFSDALIEAEETGTNIALVETYYGLERLDIIRRYNQEIVDLIEEGMKGINDSILSVLQSAEGWDEVAYQSIQVAKLVDKLTASLGNLGSGIDFSVFSSLSDTSEFLETLENFIDITVSSGESITDQILLVEELRTAVVARYEAEVSAAEELEGSIYDSISALRDLSEEIGSFLDDLFVGDLSPLTNAQKLAEAQTQFDENLQNVLSQDTALAESARDDLLESASTLLELANLFFAIGPEYQAIFNDVVGSLESIDQSILDEIGISEETLAIQSLESTLTELQLQTISQLQTLDSILVALEDQNTINLNNELSLYVPEIINSLDTITTKLEQVNNDSWNPILQQLITLNNTMSNLSSYGKGSEEIGFDQVAMIHKGETILTADTSEAIRSGETIYGSSDVLTSSSTSGSNADVVSAIQVLTQVLANGQEDIIDKNEEIRQATQGLSTDINVSRSASAKGII